MDNPAKNLVKELPQRPGVYLYFDDRNIVIYVGKAKSLRSRVGSYFNVNLDPTSKTKALVDNIRDIRYIEVASEFEALILEAELIRKYKPFYNIDLKDDKSYLYISIKKEKVSVSGKKIDLPKIIAARKNQLNENDINFGPYPSASTVRYIIRTIRKIFAFRDCSEAKFNKYHKVNSPCLYGHIGLCSGPCVNNGDEALKRYKSNVIKVKRILSGESSELLTEYARKMKQFAAKKEYEKAAEYRDILNKFDYVRQNFRIANDYIANPYLADDESQKALEELRNALPFLVGLPLRIECYDISNFSGKQAVGSMVVATDGKIDKDEYRRFRIRFKNTPDDYEMMYEVLERRFNNVWRQPDLLVVDGGKGQVSAAMSAIEEAELNIPIIGLAKKFETIVYKEGTNFVELRLPKTNKGLSLLIRLRDESHRFAQKYHHLLMIKNISKQ